MQDLVVIGAGGFGREVIDVVRAINAHRSPRYHLAGVVDDGPSSVNRQRLASLDVPYLGGREVLADLHPATQVAIGIGSPMVREAIARHLAELRLRSPSLIHPTAVLGSATSLNEGLIACAGVSIGTNVDIGRYVHLNPHAVIGHDTVVGDFVSVNPNATVSGECRIGDGVLVGANAMIINGATIGAWVTVGASAGVVRDVPAGVIAKGLPAEWISDE